MAAVAQGTQMLLLGNPCSDLPIGPEKTQCMTAGKGKGSMTTGLLATVATGCTARQDIPLAPGIKYTLSFQASSLTAKQPLTVTLAGAVLATVGPGRAFSEGAVTAQFTAPACDADPCATTLELRAAARDAIFLDDLSVKARVVLPRSLRQPLTQPAI